MEKKKIVIACDSYKGCLTSKEVNEAHGKDAAEILERAKNANANLPVWLISGGISDKEALLAAGFDKVITVTPEDMPLSEAMKPETAKGLLINIGKNEIHNF